MDANKVDIPTPKDDDESTASVTAPPPLMEDILTKLHKASEKTRDILRGSSTPRKIEKPRLTLSAFRRPEETIRLTNADHRRKIQDQYDLYGRDCGVLGHGAFSVVRCAIRKRDGVKVAVKSIAKHNALRSKRLRIGGQRYLEEWEILRRMHHHPYVVTLLDVFETNDEIQLVMEYCSGGELFNALQKKRNKSQCMLRGQYSEAEASRITSQILWALRDLHAQGIVHRDIKPENILLQDEEDGSLHVKLCDFGTARNILPQGDNAEAPVSPFTPSRSRAMSMIGSNYYAAPEIVQGGKYGTAVDMYSLGATLYIILCGFPPVFDQDNHVMFPNFYWKDVSEEAKAFVNTLLSPDPATRITAEEALIHSWVVSRSESSITSSINLDLVRSRLRRSISNSSSVRQKRRSSALIALADLYHGRAVSPQRKIQRHSLGGEAEKPLVATAFPC